MIDINEVNILNECYGKKKWNTWRKTGRMVSLNYPGFSFEFFKMFAQNALLYLKRQDKAAHKLTGTEGSRALNCA